MTKFTQIVVGVFVALLIAGALVVASTGRFDSALLLAAIALFFLIVARMAVFEARHRATNPEPGAPLGTLTTQLKRLWNVPGLEGKLYVILLATVWSIWLVQQVAALI